MLHGFVRNAVDKFLLHQVRNELMVILSSSPANRVLMFALFFFSYVTSFRCSKYMCVAQVKGNPLNEAYSWKTRSFDNRRETVGPWSVPSEKQPRNGFGESHQPETGGVVYIGMHCSWLELYGHPSTPTVLHTYVIATILFNRKFLRNPLYHQ